MTASEQNRSPDFFEDHDLDPMAAASGKRPTAKPPVKKRKVGFYVSESLLDRFNRRFHQMKLDGVTVENKSALLEAALAYALDDLDRGEHSKIGAELG